MKLAAPHFALFNIERDIPVVAIVALINVTGKKKQLFLIDESGETLSKNVDNLNAYLIAAPNVIVTSRTKPLTERAKMQFGNHPYYGSSLIFSREGGRRLTNLNSAVSRYLRPLYGSKEFISGSPRSCLWIEDDEASDAMEIPEIAELTKAVVVSRKKAKRDNAAQKLAEKPYRFRDQATAEHHVLTVPRVSSESRSILPVGLLSDNSIIQDQAFALYGDPLWNMAIIASRIHLVWIATVCGKLETRYRYPNTLGWNTFPVPTLTEKNKADLTCRAEDILLARKAHFPATIADLYAMDKEGNSKMSEGLRAAYDCNDETLERIYIGRRFRNDTERLEKLFEMYTTMTTKVPA